MQTHSILAIVVALAFSPLIVSAQEAVNDPKPRAIVDEPSERHMLGYGTDGIAPGTPPEGYGPGVTSNLGGPQAPIEADLRAPGVSDENPPGIDQSAGGRMMGYGTDGIAPRTPPEGYGPGVTSNLGGAQAPVEAESGAPRVSDENPRGIDESADGRMMGYGTDGIAERVEPGNIGLESNLGAPDASASPGAQEAGPR